MRKLIWVVLVSLVTMPMCSFMRVVLGPMVCHLQVMRILCFGVNNSNLSDDYARIFV